MGSRGSQVCIEAAICEAMGLPHGDDPKCVAGSVRSFKIRLNDSPWSSPAARAAGLHDLGLAQLGSLGIVNDVEFNKKLAEKTIRVLLPTLFREIFPDKYSASTELLKAADRCEAEGTAEAARAAAFAAYYAVNNAAYWSAYWASTSTSTSTSSAALASNDAAASAAFADAARKFNPSSDPDKYLKLSAKLVLEILTELKSPGVELL
jgi:hypothetical protein